MSLRSLWYRIVGPPIAPAPLFSADVERRILLALTAVEANMAAMVDLQRSQVTREDALRAHRERPDTVAVVPRRRAPNEGFRRPPAHEPD